VQTKKKARPDVKIRYVPHSLLDSFRVSVSRGEGSECPGMTAAQLLENFPPGLTAGLLSGAIYA